MESRKTQQRKRDPTRSDPACSMRCKLLATTQRCVCVVDPATGVVTSSRGLAHNSRLIAPQYQEQFNLDAKSIVASTDTFAVLTHAGDLYVSSEKCNVAGKQDKQDKHDERGDADN